MVGVVEIQSSLVDVRAHAQPIAKVEHVDRIGVTQTTGRLRFRAAMPYWEEAQRRAGKLFPLDEVRALARQVRRAARAGT